MKKRLNPEWQTHWINMPEFIQEKQEPYLKLIVRFETEKDLADFSKLIGQKITKKTKSIWHPFKSHWSNK
jgi:hypothetical protein